MAMGRECDRQGDLIVTWSEMARSPGLVFYDRLQEVLIAGGFDGFVEAVCQPYYAPKMGAPSVPPGRYFRMHMVSYFEGIASERGIAWRCSDSMSLRDFLRLENREKVPDHSWLSKTRGRLPHEVHERIFAWVLQLAAEQGLVKGKRIGVDASTMEANAALRTIVCRDDGRTYREMLTPPGFGGRQEGDAAAGGNRRAILRPQSRPRRHAADLAAWTRKCPQTLTWSTSPATISAS